MRMYDKCRASGQCSKGVMARADSANARTASAAVLDGSIAQIGTQYLLTLKAVNCVSGKSLASTEVQANDEHRVLDALGKTASEIRNRLGESLSTVQKFDTPLEQATTPSPEGLKAYSLGMRTWEGKGDSEAIPFFKRAGDSTPILLWLISRWEPITSTLRKPAWPKRT